MNNHKRKLFRTAELLSILTKYGFQEILIQANLKKGKDPDYQQQVVDPNVMVYERIRMAIEELGTTFIKLGQTLSNREDLLPLALIQELKKLQDNVEPVGLDLHQLLFEELGINSKESFLYIQEKPFASASISQVYKAELLDGTPVILKVKRPGIDQKVIADLLLMNDIAKVLESNNKTFKKLHITQVIKSFERSILEELSLNNELQNIIRFSQNFKDDSSVYTLKVFSEFSNDNILCMEFVEGIKISNKDQLLEQGHDTARIAKQGLDLYLKQVLEHGFFHADPHPGNIFVLANGTICFIDFGSMGRLLSRDQEILEDFVMNFIAKDAKRVIRAIKKIALEIDISSEVQLERDLLEIFELLNNDSLSNIDIKVVLKRFSAVLNKNDVVMPDYVYLLTRGVILMEGIGRTLDPDMNIVENIRPYIQKIILRRLSPNYVFGKVSESIRTFNDRLIDIPENINDILSQLKEGRFLVQQEDKALTHSNREVATALNRIALALLIVGLYVASSVLILADMPPKLFDVPILGVLGVLLSGVLTIIALVSFFKKVK